MMTPPLISIEWTQPPWWILLVMLLAALAATHLYYRWARLSEAKPWQRILMAALRFFSVMAIGILLLQPMIKRVTSTLEPKYLPILIDNSRSIVGTEGNSTSAQAITSSLGALSDELASSIEVRTYYFDSEVREDVDTPYLGTQTNISDAIKHVREELPEERIAGMILATDGIYTQGRNPQYLSSIARTPIYVVPLGDTTAERDLAIADVLHNPVVYKGDAFEVEIDLRATDLQGESATTRLMRRDGDRWTTLTTLRTKIDKKDAYTVERAVIEAKQAGLIRYRVATSYGDQDRFPDNNVRDFYVEVIASRQQILLYALSPHPDLRALRAAWTSRKNYEVDIAYTADDKTPDFSAYDLVVLHQLPSAAAPDFATVHATLDRIKKPRWYIVGGQSDLSQLNALQPMVKIAVSSDQSNDVNGRMNAAFNFFKVQESSGVLTRSAPPLASPFGTFTPHPAGRSLWYQTISGVETDDPLLVLGSWDDTRQAILLGEGLWRWRIFDYVQHESHEIFDAMVEPIAQYLAVDANKKRFDIANATSLYDQHEVISLSASYFNESYELDNSKDIELTLTDDQGDQSSYVFSKAGDTYKLVLGRLAPGRYSYVGQVVGEPKNKERGSFEVRAIDVEIQRMQADHQLLVNIANKSGGRFIRPDSIDDLTAYLKDSPALKPTYLSQEARSSILDLWWLLPLILLSLGGEWFLRKYVGSY